MSSALPGRATFDGVVVSTDPGGSPVTLFIVLSAVFGASVAVGVVLMALVLLFGMWMVPLVVLFLVGGGICLFAGMIWSWLQPDGLRIGTGDVALLHGKRVVWRRPLGEIERVDWSEGREWLTLVSSDGERRSVSLGRMWNQPGAMVLLVHHLRSAVNKAHGEREAPDDRLLALVRSAAPGGSG